jgi:hypothetical protein
MAITMNYQKRKNIKLFEKLNTLKTPLENTQNYIPIYKLFFSLNTTNYNSINLNHKWYINNIKENCGDDENIYTCKLKYTDSNAEDNDLDITQKVFFKLAPLLDPFKYLLGKYNHNDKELFNLPTIDSNVKVHPKIEEVNNSAYVDSFFSYLTSQTLHNHNFIHGLDFYGSFLSIKNNYKINIIDDLEHLVQSDFFNKNKNILFNVEDYSHLINNDKEILKPINICNISNKSAISVKSIDNNMYENIFTDEILCENNITLNGHITLDDIKDLNMDLIDVTNSIDISESKNTTTLKSDSSCSSRTSHTNENSINGCNGCNDNCENSDSDSDSNSDSNSGGNSDNDDGNNEDFSDSNDENNWDDIDSDDDSNESTIEEEKIMLSINQFPVQIICMECCENTLDNLIILDKLSREEWFSVLMQIIMILITYQKMFLFTHNDLHTSNIMYVETKQPFIYYKFKNKYYKVPTFGKIYKLIDFGRAIYKFNGKIFCSDSFQIGGDAYTQYNTEPYFNDKKPRLEPNFSFDLCRLACSIFDYIVEDFDSIKNINNLQNDNTCDSLVKLIVEWCIDDNGINVLYKNNGTERYPDFKLYKMIARCVHKHTPHTQLDRPEFSKFLIHKKQIVRYETIIDIDELPSYA